MLRYLNRNIFPRVLLLSLAKADSYVKRMPCLLMLCTHPSIFGFPRNYECVYLLRASTKTSDNHLGQDLENTLSEEGLPIPAFFSLSMQHGAERAAESLFDGLFSIKSTLELLFVTFGVSLGFKSS